MALPYEVLLDIARLGVERALDASDCLEFHRTRLVEMQQDLDAMYGAVLINKGFASDVDEGTG